MTDSFPLYHEPHYVFIKDREVAVIHNGGGSTVLFTNKTNEDGNPIFLSAEGAQFLQPTESVTVNHPVWLVADVEGSRVLVTRKVLAVE